MRLRAAAVAVFGVALLVRLGLLERQGLWVDEVFSLAIATGHSLEHPAGHAQTALGDFVEPPGALHPEAYRRYLAHETARASVGRVLRAVSLSDTSPPLYYLLLHLWTRVAGTGDASLRGFSIFWAVAGVPILWGLAARIGGRRAAVFACLLFACAPLSVYYSTEGRMYSLLWFWVLSAAWLTLRLGKRGPLPAVCLAWVLVSAAGLLTHYFFVFVWAGMVVWLILHAGRVARRMTLAGVFLAGLAVLPWYARLPEDLLRWRVTGYWLTMEPADYDPQQAPLQLALGFVATRGLWGGGRSADQATVVVYAIYALAGAVLVWKLRWRALQGRCLLLWLWLAAACLGPALFDHLRGTYTAAIPRYALAGMPAAFLLMGLGLSRLPARIRWALLALVIVCWLPGWRRIYSSRSRSFCPLQEVARDLGQRAVESDLILVHSIPSGVLGIARYLQAPVPVASWVGQLGQRRVPESVASLTSGRRRVFLVLVHTVGEPAPEEAYLRERATPVRDERRQTARIIEFAPPSGERFPVAASVPPPVDP